MEYKVCVVNKSVWQSKHFSHITLLRYLNIKSVVIYVVCKTKHESFSIKSYFFFVYSIARHILNIGWFDNDLIAYIIHICDMCCVCVYLVVKFCL